MDYVDRSFQKHVIKKEFDNNIKKEVLLQIINAAKEKGVNIQEPYCWFEKLEEMADFYNNNYAAHGEVVDPHL